MMKKFEEAGKKSVELDSCGLGVTTELMKHLLFGILLSTLSKFPVEMVLATQRHTQFSPTLIKFTMFN
jgi:hypothetical protein